MRIKTNQQQLEGITLLVRIMMDENQHDSLIAQLIRNMVNDVWVKWNRKLYPARPKDWGFTLTDNEAMALVIYWQAVCPPLGYDYEVLQMERIVNEISAKLNINENQLISF